MYAKKSSTVSKKDLQNEFGQANISTFSSLQVCQRGRGKREEGGGSGRNMKSKREIGEVRGMWKRGEGLIN